MDNDTIRLLLAAVPGLIVQYRAWLTVGLVVLGLGLLGLLLTWRFRKTDGDGESTGGTIFAGSCSIITTFIGLAMSATNYYRILELSNNPALWALKTYLAAQAYAANQ